MAEADWREQRRVCDKLERPQKQEKMGVGLPLDLTSVVCEADFLPVTELISRKIQELANYFKRDCVLPGTLRADQERDTLFSGIRPMALTRSSFISECQGKRQFADHPANTLPAYPLRL